MPRLERERNNDKHTSESSRSELGASDPGRRGSGLGRGGSAGGGGGGVAGGGSTGKRRGKGTVVKKEEREKTEK